MSQLTDRLERDLREIAAGAHPSPSAWESIVARLGDDEATEVVLLAPAAVRSKRPVWLAVAAAALVIIGLAAVLTTVGDDHSGPTGPSTSTFVSPRNGFSVEYPDTAEVTLTPATQLWWLNADDGFDVVETGSGAVFEGSSTEFPGDHPCLNTAGEPISCGTIDEQVDEYLAQDDILPGGCGVPRSQQAEITIDGQPGRVAECPDHIEATVVAGGRLYLFTLSHDRSDARAAFDAFAATIDLRPETAVHFAGLTETFVSPTYGYSFGYIRGLTPATERWDPSSQPLDSIDFDGRFDAVETGVGAYLEGASTPIPEGVSIDEWVDEYVTSVAAGGCGVPRRQQAEVSIDGQLGKTAECVSDGVWQIEATVVAGGRLYLFRLYRGEPDARAMFDAWIATIDLTPETAAAP